MKNILLILIAFPCLLHGKGYSPKPQEKAYFEKVVKAIYHAEGKHKAKVPYGILSVKVKSHNEAKQVCYNTVKNNYGRWIKAGRKGDFIEHLAKVYCPVSDTRDVKGLNKNWPKNVKYFLKKV